MVQTWILHGVSIFMVYATSMLVVILLSEMANQGWRNAFGENWQGPEERMWHHFFIWPLVPLIAGIVTIFAIMGIVSIEKSDRLT